MHVCITCAGAVRHREDKMSRKDKTKRFRILEEQNLHVGFIRVMVDLETGVNYIMVSDEANCGITPLLDAENKPVVSSPEDLEALKEAAAKEEADRKKKKEEKATARKEKEARKAAALKEKEVKPDKKAGKDKADKKSDKDKAARKKDKKSGRKSGVKPVDPYADL